MRKILLLTCGILMISNMTLAENTAETCADGAGTVVVGAVTGYKYCMSNKKMNWWNANAWCDGLGRSLFDLKTDCACSDTMADCYSYKCPEIYQVYPQHQIWTATTGCTNGNYYYSFELGYGRCNNNNRGDSGGGYALCK